MKCFFNKVLFQFPGKYNLLTFGSEVQDRDVEEIYVHPQYNHTVFFNDIAVLKIRQPAEINNFVRPCCLWEDSSELETIIGRQGKINYSIGHIF